MRVMFSTKLTQNFAIVIGIATKVCLLRIGSIFDPSLTTTGATRQLIIYLTPLPRESNCEQRGDRKVMLCEGLLLSKRTRTRLAME
jgi:hypothetical protein